MTPELHAFLLSTTANMRVLAEMLARVAENVGFPEAAKRCRSVAEDMLDAYNALEEL